MKISVTTEYVQENVQALRELREGVPREARLGVEMGLKPIVSALKEYPAVPTYVGSQKRPHLVGLNTYRRTGMYGREISQPLVSYTEGEIVGTIVSKAPYSKWVRGDLSGYLGAWMHLNIWEPVQDIVDRLLPQAQQRIEAGIEALIKRLGLGG